MGTYVVERANRHLSDGSDPSAAVAEANAWHPVAEHPARPTHRTSL